MNAAGMTPRYRFQHRRQRSLTPLYEACRFTPWHLIDDCVKPIPAWSS